jgi:hypothetical protein
MSDLQTKIEKLTPEERETLVTIGKPIKTREYNRRYREKNKKKYEKIRERFFIKVALEAQENEGQ